MSLIVQDCIYFEFLNRLSIENIRKVFQKALPMAKAVKIQKKQLMDVLGDVFGKFYNFPLIFKQIYNRFRKIKCDVIGNKDQYYITGINQNEEIDLYELCCALTAFSQCEFDDKIMLLFELNDLDDDGYINENELRRMIRTLYALFSNDESSIKSNSTILNQSLADIKANQSINMLLYSPGELKEVFHNQRYIDFPLFFERMKRIPRYKYKLIPFFITMKDCLQVQLNEQIIEMTKENCKDYLKVSNEIINPMTSRTKSFDFKKSLETKNKIQDKRNFLFNMNNHKRKKHIALKAKVKRMNSMVNISGNADQPDEFRVSFIKIRNMEALPGKVKFINGRSCSLPEIHKQTSNTQKLKFGYKTIKELILEINKITNNNKLDDYSKAEMNNIQNKLENTYHNTKNYVFDRPLKTLKIFFPDSHTKEDY